ncbi:hypothetical protein FC34_GL000649 [Lacticaseibacillus brantae DSM 23927]|uniref:DNA-directed RNA polymerase subunit beta n=1 Tax=Lacticaseibacillus brantae DSM 23927 TaxID=1423727 RepID=A0A0R2B956_9LACO|nr:DNA-directed RNA polymerase subunit beta [Lacticaseibacillus brantae]KRM72937.1 hypothetical protein FC34_GL000649 [Lacticaseibacillus brantae DSM 23927]
MSPTYARRILKKIGIGLLSALILLILGLMIGYGVGGGNPFRVFLPSTWQHIFDFLK